MDRREVCRKAPRAVILVLKECLVFSLFRVLGGKWRDVLDPEKGINYKNTSSAGLVRLVHLPS